MQQALKQTVAAAAIAASMLLAGAAAVPTHAEVVEEIVAWVDGDIITLSMFREEEQQLIQGLYREFTGEELDREVEAVREGLLLQLVDAKILLHRAERMFDTERMREAFFDMFKDQRGITDDAEFQKLLAQQGMTLDVFKDRLLERWAPERVISFEVSNRISIGDREVDTYYETHPEEFAVPGEVTLREIVILAEGDAKEDRRAEAVQAHQRATAPEADFAEVAKEVSGAGTAASGGLLGPLKQGELAEKLETVAFSLEPGAVSEVLEMPYGFHILRVEERTDPHTLDLEEVRERLRMMLEDRKYAEELERFLEKARNEADVHVNPKYLDRLPPNMRQSLAAKN
jgi:parvulin-like peptidyl-prolyl isomerase